MFNDQWKVSILGDQWKVLMFGGQWEEKHLSPFSTFPSTNFTWTFIFSFDLKVLFYHGSKSLLTHFLSFPWPINYNHAFQCNKSSMHSLLIWLKIEDFFSFPWNYGVAYGHVLQGLKLHKWMENRLWNHL
jgi:hypothetical protein